MSPRIQEGLLHQKCSNNLGLNNLQEPAGTCWELPCWQFATPAGKACRYFREPAGKGWKLPEPAGSSRNLHEPAGTSRWNNMRDQHAIFLPHFIGIAACHRRFMATRRPRHWTGLSLYWQRDLSHTVARWFAKPSSPFSALKHLYLRDVAVDVRHLSVLRCLEDLSLCDCHVVVGPMSNPWPLLSSGSRTLKSVHMGNATIEMTDEPLAMDVSLVEVNPLAVRAASCTSVLHLYCPKGV